MDTILTTPGLPNINYIVARNSVAKKWHIIYVNVQEQLITDQIYDSIEAKNQKTYKHLEAKYGKNWEETYKQEIEEERNKLTMAMEVLNADPRIRETDSLMALNGIGRQPLYPIPTGTENIYTATIVYWGIWDGIYCEYRYFEIEINLLENSVIFISDEIELLRKR